MKILFDTSALIAALLQSHPANSAVYPWIVAVSKGQHQGVVSAHSMAEVYNKLTRLPVADRLSASAAAQVIKRSIQTKFEIVPLGAADYSFVIQHLAEHDLVGGIIYDALILYAARKASVDHVLTLNPKHFRRISADMVDRIIDPTDEAVEQNS